MKKSLSMIVLMLLVMGSLMSCQSKKKNVKETPFSETTVWLENSYDVVRVHPRKHQILMDWKDDAKEPMRSISNFEADLLDKGHNPYMITNAGIYMEDSTPLGLYVEKGKTRKETNRVKEAYGNFYMQPNGIFYLKGKDAGVLPTDSYDPLKDKFDYATQSGPLLVIDGIINPQFNEESENLKLRSGVGVDLSGNVFFIISRGPVSFYEFATLFREKYSCPYALYLDGVISRMYLPVLQRAQKGGNFGAMIAVMQ